MNVTEDLQKELGVEKLDIKAFVFPDYAEIEIFVPSEIVFGLTGLESEDKKLAVSGHVLRGVWKNTASGYKFDYSFANKRVRAIFGTATARDKLGNFFDRMAQERGIS